MAAMRTPPRPKSGLISTGLLTFTITYNREGALQGFGVDPPGSRSSPGKTGSLAQKDSDRPADGADGTSMAPALDTAAAVIIPALPLPCEATSGSKSFNRMTAVPATATNAATSAGIFL
jgi:hypothetical protein